ncbi:MAG TPA: RNA polymerase sigma factor [Solirubrobacterales bacterium]|nr:RNA polymerase sigma factor [Solirubrobacterales bacterium]
MKTAASDRSDALSRRLRLLAAQTHGVGPQQVPFIGTDPELFEAFYREHVEGVQRFVARRVGDRQRAADLTAEIFLAAIDASARFDRGRGTPKAWLYGIARLLVADDRRRRGRERIGEERLRGSALLGEDDAARMDARIDAEAQSRHLYEAMDRLPVGERAVLELVALDELSVTEAATATRIRSATARVRLHRARRRLRAELEASAQPTAPKEES